MVNQNGSRASVSYVLLTDRADTWINDLQQELAKDGFPFVPLPLEQVDGDTVHGLSALIAIMEPDDTPLLQRLREQEPEALFIHLRHIQSAIPNPTENGSVFDTIIAYPASDLAQQVLPILKLHRENQLLRAHIRSLDEQIQQQQRSSDEIEVLKNAIVRNVSHELRTPLLQVKSAVKLIAEDVSEEKLVSFADTAMARLEILVKNITMYGQSLDIRLGPIILRDSVEFARRNLGRVWERRTEADRIHLKLQENLPPVLADKQGLSTVLQLLMDNALKFSSKDKPIEVIGCQRDDHVYIGVRDYGIGIAQDKIQDIFESFYQIDHSSTRRYGGMGIGLALVKLILDHHNTEIHVDSQLGKGSTFWFLLPKIDLEREEPPE